MKRLATLFLISLSILQHTYSQDYKLTFSGSGESEEIDSLVVQNLTQGTSLKMSGTDTLLLYKTTTGLTSLLNRGNELKVFPNPTQDNCYLEFLLNSNENVFVRLFEISGKQLGFWNQYLNSGIHQIQIKNLNQGIYIVQLQTKTCIKTAKIVSNGENKDFPVLSHQFLGKQDFQQPILKSTSSVSPLPFPYMEGDEFIIEAWTKCDLVLHGRCPSAILPLPIPKELETHLAHVYEFVFYNCVDKCGNSYPTVTIGDQVWMAENLNCETDSGSWVYDGDENNAKIYGRLYTWQEALANAPEGWHLPTIDEWKQFYDYLKAKNNNNSEISIDAIKSNTYWFQTDEGESGNGTNASGMCLLPGGFYNNGNFNGIGLNGNHWTSTTWNDDASYAQIWRLFRWNTSIGTGYMTKDDMGISVRYVKDMVP